MKPPLWTTFPSLEQESDFTHAFTLRHPDIDVEVDRTEALRRLTDWHHEVVSSLEFSPAHLATAEQVHGNAIAVVDNPGAIPFSHVDGLVCNHENIMLAIYVADCCAIYLVDRRTRAFGLLHSGRKGTEQNITGRAIQAMSDQFGTEPEDLIVQLSPCIRPPAFEVDFAATICEQALDAGVEPANIHDAGICTSSDLSRYYSYRLEKGKTGRMLALLGRKG
ncbi:MAG: hypothetical protein RL693_1132 [Verrucomicrobiota bacterium]|jgi:copper oxidase (laccase) domain-containing protein